MNEKTMKFTDDQGNKVEYAILEQKLINKTEYVAMAPVTNKNDVEIFKIKFDKDWNETSDRHDLTSNISQIIHGLENLFPGFT